MACKLVNGIYALGPGGLPLEVDGLDELLQNAAIRLAVPKGGFPYGREIGSFLDRLDPKGEHAAEQAVALANEALLGMPGVSAEGAEIQEDGKIRFLLVTPLGKGEILFGDI